MEITFGEKLKNARTAKKMKQSDLANQLGVTNTTVSNWENNISRPDLDMLSFICGILHVNASYFLQAQLPEDEVSIAELNMVKKYRSLDPYRQETVSIVLDREYHTAHMLKNADRQESAQAPVIDIQPKFGKNGRLIEYFHSASAGSGVYILGNEVADKIQIPDTEEYKEVDYAIKVRGDSMLPDYCNGDIALVSQRKEMQIGDIGIFVKNGDTYIKELGKDKLISKNDHYPNIPVTDLDNIVCMGKVVGKFKSNLDLSEEDISLLHEARNRLINNDSNSKKTV